MSNAISTNDQLIAVAAFAMAETPILEKCQCDISNEYAPGNSDIVRVELDSYPVFTEGETVSADSDIIIEGVNVQVKIHASTSSLGVIEKNLDIESLDRQVNKPAGVALASKIERICADAAISFAEHVTVSTGTFTQLSTLSSMIRQTKLGRELMAFLPPTLYSIIAQSGVNSFGQSLGQKLYTGELGEYMGCEYFRSTDLPVIDTGVVPVAGTSTVTATVNTNGATSLALGGLSAATGMVKRGTVFTITGKESLNLLGDATGSPRWFVVQADATVSGSAATVTVSPIYFQSASGVHNPKANVSGTSIASGTTIGLVPQTASSRYLVGVMFDPKVMAYGAKPLPKFEDQGSASSSMMAGKVSIRKGMASNMANGSQKVRWDSMFGIQPILGKGVGLTMYKV